VTKFFFCGCPLTTTASSQSDTSAETRPPDEFRCADCGKVCKSKAGLTLHRKVHKSDQPPRASESVGKDQDRENIRSGTLPVAERVSPRRLPSVGDVGATASVSGGCESARAGEPARRKRAHYTPL
jgi:hypothetical protein